MKWKEYAHEFEWHLLFLALVLSLVGIAFIWSASQGSDGLAQKPWHQALFLMVCIPVMLTVLKLGYRIWAIYAYEIYFILLVMLVLVLFVGRGGAARWFNIGFGFRLQPSEFMKLGVILALSRYFMYPRDLRSWRQMIPPVLLALIPMVLIVKQPDLGTALVLLPLSIGMLYTAGVPGKRLALLILAGLVLCPVVYHLPLLKEYQRERVSSYLQSIPKLDAQAKALKKEGKAEEAAVLKKRIGQLKRGSGFQQFYSQVSIGSGGLIGKGLATGPQNRLNIIPERHTDFIFAIFGDEAGFLGCSAVLLLFFLMIAIILGVARRTREPFGRYLCSGVALLFITQVFINTAISVGLLPITGLTLPFISYGGSSLLSSYVALALVLDVGVKRIRVFGSS
jgi:rod shape determining protein RodA